MSKKESKVTSSSTNRQKLKVFKDTFIYVQEKQEARVREYLVFFHSNETFFFFIFHYSGPQDVLDIPRLPDPSAIFPVPQRRKAPAPPIPDPVPLCLISPLERPKTLEFAPRPRPTPARMRADPWKLGSLSRTLSSSPGSSCDSPLGSGDSSTSNARPNLMDMDVEGQSLDNTVPLCGKQQPATLYGQQYS